MIPREGRGAAVAIGNFDGVNRGHRVLIAAAHAIARRNKAPLGVVTFEPHPRMVIAPRASHALLSPFKQKARSLERLGVDMLYVLRFDRALMTLQAQDFVTHILLKNLGVAGVVTGTGFRFGHKREGDTNLLCSIASRQGIECETIAPVEFDGERCSSSRIRGFLNDGQVEAASHLLGQPYALIGTVKQGDQRGRTIGFPTANVHLPANGQLIPAKGVYAVEAIRRDGVPLPAVANLGTRPTVDGRTLLLEVHLLDRTINLYNERLEVRFLNRLRGEQKFDGLDQLKAQIAKDCDRARIIFGVAPRTSSQFDAAPAAMSQAMMS